MEEKKKRGRPPNKRYISEVSVGVKMIEAAQKKKGLAPMTPEQEDTYRAMVTHGLGFLANLGKLILLFGNPPDDYQI